MKTNANAELDDRTRWLLETAFIGFVGKSYDAPSESDYIAAILGMWEFVQRNIQAKRKPGRPRKENIDEKDHLYLEMQLKIRLDGLGSDRAAQSLFRKNTYGRDTWKALKNAYFSYRRDLIALYLPDCSTHHDSEKSELDIDSRLWILVVHKRAPALLLMGLN